MIQKIYNYFGLDGLLHIIVCDIVVSIWGVFLPIWIAVIGAAVIGLSKELLWDKILGKGSFDKKDLISDAIGIVIGCL